MIRCVTGEIHWLVITEEMLWRCRETGDLLWIFVDIKNLWISLNCVSIWWYTKQNWFNREENIYSEWFFSSLFCLQMMKGVLFAWTNQVMSFNWKNSYLLHNQKLENIIFNWDCLLFTRLNSLLFTFPEIVDCHSITFLSLLYQVSIISL